MKIPKIIHFIWAGGDRPMPDPNVEVVKSWAISNPTFDIFLWVDLKSLSSPAIAEDNKRYYHQLLGDLGDRVHLKDIEGTSKSYDRKLCMRGN